ncbi:DUF2254 domain-containing protein [Roseomonas sp. CAU 1739]|uniref:DUF2254 domain-containing protein n=1 Tax=Roseomonas sp. CAU 1739 TaxID=3140364 RepID=UPI00325B3214
MPVWTIPLAYTVTSMAMAQIVPRLERAFLWDLQTGLALDSALTALAAVASGMMALTGIVFSIAFVMVQFSAISYSPRLATRFARDPLLYHALGIFFATFTYSLAAIVWSGRDGTGHVPVLSVAIAGALLAASMCVVALLVQRLRDLQIGQTLRFVGNNGRAVIAQTFAARPEHTRGVLPAGPPEPEKQLLRFAGAPIYVMHFDTAALVALARRARATIIADCAVGDMLMDGTVMLRVHGGAEIPEAELRRAIHLGPERTFLQDPKFPIRLLVDIAIKALSPAINDPTTAVQALDEIEDLLRRLAVQDLDIGRITDGDGALRLVLPTPGWQDYLSLAFDEIRMFGMTSIQVMRRLRVALLRLAELLEGQDRAAEVLRYLQHIDAAIERSALDEHDRASARQEDPQGLGLAR